MVLGGLGAGLLGLYAANNSWSARPAGDFMILAHRGVHQTYSREGLTRSSCTATRIPAPTHDFLENTLPSMREAFRLGADAVEIDIHPTADGEFAVFHDWTIDCRTEGKGVTREQTMAYLRTLDLGYGYTADGGKTFPLRGKGVGMMPTLGEVLAEFPDKAFQLNIKSNDPAEADKLFAYLSARPYARPERLTVFGGDRPVTRLRAHFPRMRMSSKRQLKKCLGNYLLTGWTGHVPKACHNAVLAAPTQMGWVLWGWPNRFLQRMEAVNSEVWLGSGVKGMVLSLEGVDDADAAASIPDNWRGGVQTDRIEVVGPVLRPRKDG